VHQRAAQRTYDLTERKIRLDGPRLRKKRPGRRRLGRWRLQNFAKKNDNYFWEREGRVVAQLHKPDHGDSVKSIARRSSTVLSAREEGEVSQMERKIGHKERPTSQKCLGIKGST